MGIVVTICMLLGLLALLKRGVFSHAYFMNTAIGSLFLGGLWNSLWHGLRHWEYFWGQAALISGVFMVAVALLMASQSSVPYLQYAFLQTVYRVLKPIRWGIILGLFLSFLLYAVTLVRMNIGV